MSSSSSSSSSTSFACSSENNETESKGSDSMNRSKQRENNAPSPYKLEITQQDVNFLKEHGIDLNTQKKLRKRLERMQPHTFETYKMQQMISRCMKEMDLQKAIDIYNTAKEKSITIGQDSLHALLSLASGLGEQGSTSGPLRTEEPPSDYNMALSLFMEMKVCKESMIYKYTYICEVVFSLCL